MHVCCMHGCGRHVGGVGGYVWDGERFASVAARAGFAAVAALPPPHVQQPLLWPAFLMCGGERSGAFFWCEGGCLPGWVQGSTLLHYITLLCGCCEKLMEP